MTTPWLSVVGIGEDGLEGLTAPARAVVDAAEFLVGGARHLAMVPEDGRPRLEWPKPLSEGFEEIAAWRGRPVCVLATGNPLWYGVANTLQRHFDFAEMRVLPHLSAFELAAARLGWSMADLETLTLHGRPAAALQPAIQPGARLLVLSENGGTPAQVAEILCHRGFGESRLWVMERLGGPHERIREATAEDWASDDVADLNTIAVECVAGPDAQVLSAVPGLPDEAFRHDGQLTKREVRAATLAALMPGPRQYLWDVGAGCGSIAIEWMRAASRSRAVAVERRQDRLGMIAENAMSFGVPNLEIVAGEAPGELSGLDAPDAVFVGGGLTASGLLETCWGALKPGGRLVANAVTLEGEKALAGWHAVHDGEMVRLQVSRLVPVGPYHGWRPFMPVTQYRARKPWSET